MPSPSTEVRRLFEAQAIAAGGTFKASIPVRSARMFSFYLFATTLGGGAGTITFSAQGAPGATAVTVAANLFNIGIVEVQAVTSAAINTTGTTGVYKGISDVTGGTPGPITGHNFDVIVTITGGTGAVINGYSVVAYE